MGLPQSGSWLTSFATAFALAWIMLASSGRADDGSTVLAPPPTFITSYRTLVRSPHPVNSLIKESVAFSPDGNAVASAQADVKYDKNGKQLSSSTIISICNPKDGSLTGRFDFADSQGCPVAYSPDGLTAAIGLGPEVKLYDPLTQRERASLRGNDHASFEKLAFSADGRRLAAASYDSVVVWDLAAANVMDVINARTGFVHGIAFSRDGTKLATASEGPSLSASVCRMIIIPLFYHVTGEDSRGRELKGWAEISGRFWSTPEYVPLRVDYFVFRPRARKTTPPLTLERIALWDKWLDRESQL